MPARYQAIFDPIHRTSPVGRFLVGRGINASEKPLDDRLVATLEVVLYMMDVARILLHCWNNPFISNGTLAV